MAVIQSGDSTDQLKVDPTSKAARTSLYDQTGTAIGSANPLSVSVTGSSAVSGSVSVTNFPATQAVSAASLPLPAGAATAANQGTANTSLSSLDGKTPAVGQKAMAASSPVVLASDQSVLPVSGSVSVSNFPGTQPVSATALPLPAGAAADATLSGLSAKFGTLGAKSSAGSAPVVLATDQSAIATTVGGTVAISAAGLPLPAGASTETTLGALSAKFGALGQKAAAGSAPVVLASDQSALPVNVGNFPATQAVSATALPLPAGAATATGQGTGNSSLASIDGKTPALGQAGMAASVPVAIASNQSSLGVTVANFPATQAVSAVSLPLPSGASTEATLASLSGKFGTLGAKTSANSAPVVLASDQASLAVSVGNFPSTQAISAASLPLPTGAAADTTLSGLSAKFSSLGAKASAASAPVVLATDQASLNVTVGNFPATQAISAASLPLPAGAAADSTLSGLSAKFGSLGAKASAASAPVVLATDQATLPVTIGNFPSTQAISATALPLPAGASTSSAQTTANSSLASIDAKTPAVGQATMAQSTPVVLASNQSVLGVSVGNFPATQVVSGAVTANAGTALQDASTSGSFTAAGQAVTLTLPGSTSSWSVGLSGTFSAGSTVVFEATVDGTNWIGVNGRQTGVINTVLASSVSGGAAPYMYRGNSSSEVSFRVRCSVLQSGDSIGVTVRCSAGVGAVFLNASLPAGSNAIGAVAQGAAGVTAWKVDGSSVTQPVSGTVTVGNFPSTQVVSGSVSVGNFPVTQPVSGTVGINNFPATQPVSGSVGVTNFPVTQAVSVGNFPATQPVSGSVSVGNFPATQPVSGSVGVSNFPATQAVSGSVSVTGTVATNDVTTSTSALTSFAYSTASAAVVAANANRKGMVIYNASANATLWLAEGATATLTSGYPLPPGATVTYAPPGMITGAVNGIWSAGGSGNAYVTERS